MRRTAAQLASTPIHPSPHPLPPVSVKTKRGTRITFVAGFITLPLTALSLWSLLHGGEQPQHKRLPPGSSSKELDLTGK